MSITHKLALIVFPSILVILNLVLVFFLLENNVCVRNKGVAFGVSLGSEILVLLLLLVVLIFVYIKSREDLRYNVLAISILGLGNFFERVIKGYICDYIQIFDIYVNLVDLGITMTVIFSLIYLFKDIYAGKSRRIK